MSEYKHLRPLAFIQSGLFLLLLILLLAFGKGPNLFYGVLSFLLLIGYQLFADFKYTTERINAAGLMGLHVAIYLLLCTLVVWATTGEEESPFWIVYYLPIVVGAASLRLWGTLCTCAAALTMFISQLPPSMYLDPHRRVEELPELVGFGMMMILVGVLVQTFAQQNRRQLALKEELNQRLLHNQEVLKESLQRLEAAEESLRRKERLASLGEMSAGIAHEIRNPLGIISSSAQLLDRQVDDADARQLLDIIQEESARLNSLITEFLTFGRQLEPQRRPCDLATLILRGLDYLRGSAEQKGVSLTFDRQCEQCEAEVDADMLQQVLLNLLLNALDATPAGGEIRVTLQPAPGRLEISVSDTGRGIAPELIDRIFNPFFTTKAEGTGLGLANAFKIMQSHDGDLTVVSTPGQGSRFTLTLPAETV